MAATNTFNKTALANGTSNLTVRSDALNLSTDLVQAGVVFNDASRLLVGGTFFAPTGSGNQNPYLGSYVTDLHAVQNDIAAMLADPGNVTLGGQAFALNATDTALLNNVSSQLTTLINTAPQITNAANMQPTEQTLHSVQSQILGEIQGDAHLSAALNNVPFMATTGANDVAFQSLPSGADDPASLAAASAGNSLRDVGVVFNAAVDLATGGINNANLNEVTTDLTAVSQGLNNILNNQAMLAQIETGETANAAALTTVHLETALAQVNLQLNKYDSMSAQGQNEGLRGTADNLLDIIDIVQGDPNLNAAAGGTGNPGHIGGFAEDPGGLTGTGTKFQDNQAQTNFWAAFLSEANTINATLQKVATGSVQASQALITQIQDYQHFGAAFDAAQGPIFEARFDNELLSGTLLTDTQDAVKGLQGILNGDTGAALAADNALISAAGQGFAADAMDVSGNNIPVGGGHYVGSATTVATATSVNGVAHGTIPVTGTPNIANGTGGTASSATTGTSTGGTGTGTTGTGTGTTGSGGTGTTGTGTSAGGTGTGTSGTGTGTTGSGTGTTGTGTGTGTSGTGTGTDPCGSSHNATGGTDAGGHHMTVQDLVSELMQIIQQNGGANANTGANGGGNNAASVLTQLESALESAGGSAAANAPATDHHVPHFEHMWH